MNINYKSRVDKLVKKAKQKGLVKTYAQACETTFGKESMLSEEEVKYYASSKKIVKYSIGDIVFVREYRYSDGKIGNNHFFVIIDRDNTAVPIENFGMLISSNLDKLRFSTNKLLEKDEINNLHKDSIVKTDVIYKILNEQIMFKIGKVDNYRIEEYKNSFYNSLKETN